MGRTPTFKYGPVRPWSGDINSNQNSQQIADPYTFTHVTHGVGFYALLRLIAGSLPVGSRFILAMLIESAWEVFENTDFVINRYREATISLDYYGDSVINSIFDIFAAALGFWLAWRFRVPVSIIVIILLEVMLAFWIRDSLFLNILMLIYPLDVVRRWQMG